MKKFFLVIILLFSLENISFAAVKNYKIYTVKDGTVLKCTGIKQSGILKEYDKKITDYYTIENGEIYSKNLVNLFKDGNGKPKKVKNLEITDNQTTFKDRLITLVSVNKKQVTIDRKTGKYTFDAKKQYNWAWFYSKAYVVGKCSIVKNKQR